MLIRTDHSMNPEALRCPYCGSTRVLPVCRPGRDVHWDWNGEEQDGSIAPRHIVWECLDCSGFFTTQE